MIAQRDLALESIQPVGKFLVVRLLAFGHDVKRALPMCRAISLVLGRVVDVVFAGEKRGRRASPAGTRESVPAGSGIAQTGFLFVLEFVENLDGVFHGRAV